MIIAKSLNQHAVHIYAQTLHKLGSLDPLSKTVTVGLANVVGVLETALANGCELSDTGRLLFPNAVIENTLKVAAKNFAMHDRDAAYDFIAKNVCYRC